MFHVKHDFKGYPQCTGLSNKLIMPLVTRLLLCSCRLLHKRFIPKRKGYKRLWENDISITFYNPF